MAGMGVFRRLWLTRFSSPVGERPLWRHLLERKPAKILELGLGTLARTEQLLELARGLASGPVHYVGLDRFEGRLPSDPPGVSLKEAYRRLHRLGKVQLVPGNVDASLARVCNHLGSFDMVLVSGDNDPRQLERVWFFLQRLTGVHSSVFAVTDSSGPATWAAVSPTRLQELAASVVLRRAG